MREPGHRVERHVAPLDFGARLEHGKGQVAAWGNRDTGANAHERRSGQQRNRESLVVFALDLGWVDEPELDTPVLSDRGSDT